MQVNPAKENELEMRCIWKAEETLDKVKKCHMWGRI